MGAYVEELFLLFYHKRYKYLYRNMKAAKLYRCAIREASHPKLIFMLRTYLIPGETLKTRQKEGRGGRIALVLDTPQTFLYCL